METRLLQCSCGATRHAPAALSIVSCVQCGRAMAPPSVAAHARPPARTLVAAATLASQLLGTLAFALALVWVVALHATDPAVIAVMVVGAACVFAGGNAHRGNVVALGSCAVLDLAVAVVCFGRLPAADAFVRPALARLHAEPYLPIAMVTVGAIGALAAVSCIAALPQARRFATWRGEQILHAARVARG